MRSDWLLFLDALNPGQAEKVDQSAEIETLKLENKALRDELAHHDALMKSLQDKIRAHEDSNSESSPDIEMCLQQLKSMDVYCKQLENFCRELQIAYESPCMFCGQQKTGTCDSVENNTQ